MGSPYVRIAAGVGLVVLWGCQNLHNRFGPGADPPTAVHADRDVLNTLLGPGKPLRSESLGRMCWSAGPSHRQLGGSNESRTTELNTSGIVVWDTSYAFDAVSRLRGAEFYSRLDRSDPTRMTIEAAAFAHQCLMSARKFAADRGVRGPAIECYVTDEEISGGLQTHEDAAGARIIISAVWLVQLARNHDKKFLNVESFPNPESCGRNAVAEIAIMHEIGHVYYGHLRSNIDNSDVLRGQELEADSFAGWLVGCIDRSCCDSRERSTRHDSEIPQIWSIIPKVPNVSHPPDTERTHALQTAYELGCMEYGPDFQTRVLRSLLRRKSVESQPTGPISKDFIKELLERSE